MSVYTVKIRIVVLLLLAAPLLLFGQVTDSVVGYAIPRVGVSDRVISHFAYKLLFVDSVKQAKWVAYSLKPEHLNGDVSRTNKFQEDPLVASGTAANADYARSGYDRGHLCPAADMSWNATAMQESFYYSNMSPQTPAFNRGIWKKLEERVREWCRQYGTVYVVVGPVLEKGLPTIGTHNVGVPRYFYKVVLAGCGTPHPKAIGFIIPNEKGTMPLRHYAVTVDSVEKVTGIDFFCTLPKQVEAKVEAAFSGSEWCW